MRILGEYRGVMFSIPRNDDGIWHYAIHPKRDRRTSVYGMPAGSGPEGLASRQEAITAAKRAIDAWLAASSRTADQRPQEQIVVAAENSDSLADAPLTAPATA